MLSVKSCSEQSLARNIRLFETDYELDIMMEHIIKKLNDTADYVESVHKKIDNKISKLRCLHNG